MKSKKKDWFFDLTRIDSVSSASHSNVGPTAWPSPAPPAGSLERHAMNIENATSSLVATGGSLTDGWGLSPHSLLADRAVYVSKNSTNH